MPTLSQQQKAEFIEAPGPTGLRRYQATAMPVRKETIPASQQQDGRAVGGELPGTEAQAGRQSGKNGM